MRPPPAPDELDAEVATGCNADRKGAPDAGEQVDRDRSDDVVYLKNLQQFHPADAQHAAHGTNYERPVVIDDIWPGCNGEAPASAPLRTASKSMRPRRGRDKKSAAMTPAAAARLVFTST